MANTNSQRQLQPQGADEQERRCTSDRGTESIPHADSRDGEGLIGGGIDSQERQEPRERSSGLRDRGRGKEWPAEPDVGRVADGVANRVDRITALGNGQVSRVAATAFLLLRARLAVTESSGHEE